MHVDNLISLLQGNGVAVNDTNLFLVSGEYLTQSYVKTFTSYQGGTTENAVAVFYDYDRSIIYLKYKTAYTALYEGVKVSKTESELMKLAITNHNNANGQRLYLLELLNLVVDLSNKVV